MGSLKNKYAIRIAALALATVSCATIPSDQPPVSSISGSSLRREQVNSPVNLGSYQPIDIIDRVVREKSLRRINCSFEQIPTEELTNFSENLRKDKPEDVVNGYQEYAWYRISHPFNWGALSGAIFLGIQLGKIGGERKLR